MTTPANNGPNNGASAPDDDDPFGYLYADGQAAGATPPTHGGGYGYPGPSNGQPRVPRTSYNQVRTVGERQYGARQQAPAQQQPHYQAPEAIQAGGYGVPQQQPPYGGQPPAAPPQHHEEPRRDSSRRGLLIGAVAVVGAVVIGIGVAWLSDKGDTKGAPVDDASPQATSAPQTPGDKAEPSKAAPSKDASLPKSDAATGSGLVLTGGAVPETEIPGAKAAGGKYVGGFNQVGAAVTWTVEVPKSGEYKFRTYYGVPGKDATATLSVNGTAQTRELRLRNHAKAKEGDWEKGWTYTFNYINLNKGTNEIKVSCEQGNQCEAVIDQFKLEPR
ncbi:CBM35 domain-containing protein [Streptomyces sp. NPDC006879]|uniref:CBM35 domain-containing protein n=1 Tax=Streptomyces sp. NPDC006879 TaxID=3364767 RepID=UPI00368EB8E5